MVVFLIPAVIFPRAFNIFSSAFVGSYLIIFAVGMFIFTSLSEIVLRVIKCATVGGYLLTEVSYPFELTGKLWKQQAVFVGVCVCVYNFRHFEIQ